MDSVTLGKKIKDARIAKKMTQNEVVGSFITRNMLSQIESGTATPSIRTLEYLCGVLDIPLGGVMPGQTEDALYKLSLAKEYLNSKKYEWLLSMSGELPSQLADEFNAIFALGSLAFSKEKWEEGDYPASARFAQNAITLSEKGLYKNTALRTEAILHLNTVAEKLSGYYANLNKEYEKI